MEALTSFELLAAALMLASVYCLVALGLNLIYGAMRLLNVAHGEIMMVGGYVGYTCFTVWGISPLVSMFFSMAVAALLGYVCYALLFKRLVHNRQLAQRLESNSLLVFFGLSVILQNLGAIAFSPDPRNYSYLDNLVQIGTISITANRLVVLGVSVAVTLIVMAFFRFSIVGLAVRALIQQRDAASLTGIDARKVNIIVFCMGFALAGLAGTLIGMTENVSPSGGFPYTISAFVVVILGGLGSLPGALLGAVVLGFVEVYGVVITSPAYRSILVYGLFILILVVRPQGLLGRKSNA